MNPSRLIATLAFFVSLVAPTFAFAAPVSLESGSLVTGAHDTAGIVTIYKLDAGDRVLRLTNFHTSNGPDVHVYSDLRDESELKTAASPAENT